MGQTVLFLSDDDRAAKAAAVFQQSAGLFRALYPVQVKNFSNLLESDISAASRVVIFAKNPMHPTAYMWAGADDTACASQLLAELMGGGAAYVPPPPPAKPKKPKSLGTVKMSRETAGRKGKGVTVVSELPLNEDDLKELATRLKNRCGSGGTAKDRRIEIQGDHRDTVQTELEKIGYNVKRSGG